MSQHDYDLANQAGAAFRADLNLVLQAIATQNSGSSAPSTTYAYQVWGDTANNLIKMRNGANSAWVIMGALADSTKTEFYTANTLRATIDSSGNMGIANASPAYKLDVTGDVNVTGAFRVGGTAIPTGYTFINAGTSSNSTDTYTATPSPAISAYAANQLFLVLINSTNTTTTPTFNFNSQGAKTVKKQIGKGKVAAAVGDLQANTFALLAYDGTDLILINPRAHSQGANVASASTIDLDAATGDFVHVTGTTTITAVTLAQGLQRTVVFDGVLTFTHGSSLILPGSANITTAAGDSCVLRGEASGVVRCISYTKANGTSVVAAGGGVFPNGGYLTGAYYYGIGWQGSSSNTWNVTANKLFYKPFVVGADTTFTKIGMEVTGSTSGNIRMGLYSWVNGTIGSLLWDFGTFSTSSTGLKEITISQLVPAGVYGIAFVSDAGPGVRACGSNSAPSVIQHLAGSAYPAGDNYVNLIRYGSHSYGALPSSVPGDDAVLTDAIGSAFMAWMRK